MKRHLKRVNAPKTWQILRRDNKFIRRPNPGSHSLDLGISMITFLKEIESLAKTSREIKTILNNKEVIVNGKRIKNPDFMVGFMDIVKIPDIKYCKRINFSDKGFIIAETIPEKESSTRLVKIIGKKQYKGKIQLTCLDGTSILTDKKEYAKGDSLSIDDKGKIIKHLPLKKGASVVVHEGKRLGLRTTVKDIKKDIIQLEKDKNVVETNPKYVFVLE